MNIKQINLYKISNSNSISIFLYVVYLSKVTLKTDKMEPFLCT